MNNVIFIITFIFLYSCSNVEKSQESFVYIIKKSNYNVMCERIRPFGQNQYNYYLSYKECINSAEYSFQNEANQKRKISDHIGMYHVVIVPEFGWAQCEVISNKEDKSENKNYETYEECTRSEEFKYYESK